MFKERMFGIPIDGELKLLNDNKSVVDSSSKLESTLNKNHNSIAYNLVKWNVAAVVVQILWVEGILNLADAFTNRLAEARRSKLFGDWTYWNRFTSQGDQVNMVMQSWVDKYLRTVLRTENIL